MVAVTEELNRQADDYSLLQAKYETAIQRQVQLEEHMQIQEEKLKLLQSRFEMQSLLLADTQNQLLNERDIYLNMQTTNQ